MYVCMYVCIIPSLQLHVLSTKLVISCVHHRLCVHVSLNALENRKVWIDHYNQYKTHTKLRMCMYAYLSVLLPPERQSSQTSIHEVYLSLDGLTSEAI